MVVNGRLSATDSIKADERVNFQVREMEINVNRVKTNKEVNKGFLLVLRNVFENGGNSGA